MSTHIEYSTEKELDDAVQELLTNDPHGLAIAEHVKLAACFVVRMDDDDTTQPGKGDPVTIKKVPPDMKCLMRPKADFLLVVDYHFWQTAADAVKRGYMGQAISRIKVERGEKGVKIGMRKYDLVTNLSVIKHHGLFTENLALAGEIISTLPKALSMIHAVLERERAKAETPAEKPEEPPRGSTRAPAKTKVAKKPTPPMNDGEGAGVSEQVEEPVERTRPARRIPPDPVPASSTSSAADEPEPED